MNHFLCLSRRFKSLNKSFLFNKFDAKINSFNYKLSLNQLIFRKISNQYVFNDTEELENQLKRAKETGGQTTDLFKKLLSNYSKRYDHLNRENPRNETIVSRVKRISNEVNQNNNQSDDVLNAILLEFFTNCADLESALEAKNRISRNFRLDSFKVFNFATLLVKNDRTNAAINLIETHLSEHKKNDKYFRDKREDFRQMRDQSINRLLNALIDKQIETEIIRKVFQKCVQISPTKINKTVLGPLIKMHLVNRDLSSALNEFVSCAQNYGIIPWNIELMRIFIETKDENSLQTVVQKSKEIYGPYNTALDMSAAYLYNGLEDKAKQEISKIKTVQQKSVELVCDKFIRDNRFDCLKTFILMTESIERIDRNKLFSLLINAYKRSGQTDKALDVLNIMKEQNIEPSEQTLKLHDRK